MHVDFVNRPLFWASVGCLAGFLVGWWMQGVSSAVAFGLAIGIVAFLVSKRRPCQACGKVLPILDGLDSSICSSCRSAPAGYPEGRYPRGVLGICPRCNSTSTRKAAEGEYIRGGLRPENNQFPVAPRICSACQYVWVPFCSRARSVFGIVGGLLIGVGCSVFAIGYVVVAIMKFSAGTPWPFRSSGPALIVSGLGAKWGFARLCLSVNEFKQRNHGEIGNAPHTDVVSKIVIREDDLPPDNGFPA